MAVDPISAIADAAKGLFDLIRQSLPSDEVRLERFKLRYPRKYARIRERIEDSLVKDLKKDYGHPNVIQVEDTINYRQADLPYTERQDLICVVKNRLGLD